MTNKYELDADKIDELYNYIFTQKEQFVHMADPNKQPKLCYIEEELDIDDSYIHALIIYRNDCTSYEEAYNSLDNYHIYDNENERNTDFEELVYSLAEDLVEMALEERSKSWLIHYIDIDEVAADMENERSYAEVLSSYEEEIEATIDGVTYYLYKC